MINSEYMEADVTEQGIIIPKEWLSGIKKVQMCKPNDRIMIASVLDKDPILKLGRNPVSCGAMDASSNPDKYLYGDL